MRQITQEMVDRVGRELIERGLIVLAGFEGYKLMFRVPPNQEERERRAFFAGAQHLFSAIMNSGLDEGAEPTEADLVRVDNIAKELKAFEGEMLRATTH